MLVIQASRDSSEGASKNRPYLPFLLEAGLFDEILQLVQIFIGYPRRGASS